MKRVTVCHYGEIGVKGKNRRFFEKRLLLNIKRLLPQSEVRLLRGRVVVFLGEKEVSDVLRKIPGISYFFNGFVVDSDIDTIRENLLYLAKEEKFNSFRVTVKRSDKSFPISSMELASILGGEIVKETGKRVDLHNPERNFYVEVTEKETYLYFEKIKGVGGLPVGTGGRAVSMLSGGIDSPVSSFRMIKRGMELVFVHFHAYPSTSKRSIEKVESIVKKLSLFQGSCVLYLVPFDNIQKSILVSAQSSLRVLLYRRFMVRIAEKVAEVENAKAIVTGESLGQVASQTVENMIVTGSVTNLPILRPLVGYDKEEIIEEAKKIETYDISILPDDDCCVRFIPKSPRTKSSIVLLEREEEKISIEELIDDTIGKIEKLTISP